MGVRDNFKKGSVEMILLALLAEQDMYGYQISQLVAERSEQIIVIPEGSMYPTLYKLVDNGYISDYRELVGKRQTRVYYHMTPKGRERLDSLLHEYEIFGQGIQKILNYKKGDEVDES